jgi:VIT1/CCC1 family predicted Fe2+/Mn2+ transporter
MNHSLKVGFNFGVTSGIITTLGLMVGLNSATNSKLAVIGGIITIAIADACSDALGIHISEEGENKHTRTEIWQSTLSTFFFKFIFASIFIIPFLFFDLKTGVIVSVILGLLLLTLFSYKLAKNQNSEKPWGIVFEHLFIVVLVIIVTYFVGELVDMFFL